MSHFTVLVIGDDVEGQLAPYDENTQVESYKVRVSDSDSEVDADRIREYYRERLAQHAEWVAQGSPDLEPLLTTHVRDQTEYWKYRGIQEIVKGEYVVPDDFETMDDEKLVIHYHEGDETYGRDDEGWYRMSTYNPLSKWDWYSVGGRWAGFFRVKPTVRVGLDVNEPNVKVNPFSAELAKQELEYFAPIMNGHYTDQAQKGQIDFDRMRSDAAAKAGEDFDRYHRLVDGTSIPKSWAEVRADCGFIDEPTPEQSADEDFRARNREAIDNARKVYHDQERTLVVNADKEFRSFMGPDAQEHFGEDRAAFIQKQVDGVGMTYAVVRDGVWYGKGEMGWWGMSHDEQDQAAWNARVAEMLDSLPDDTLLTMVDAHI